MAIEQSIVMGIALAWLFIRMLGESQRADERAERYGTVRGGGARLARPLMRGASGAKSGLHAPQRSILLAELAARQWGAVSRSQLLAAGFTVDEIRGMVERRVLHRMHRGVYVFGAFSPAPEQRWSPVPRRRARWC